MAYGCGRPPRRGVDHLPGRLWNYAGRHTGLCKTWNTVKGGPGIYAKGRSGNEHERVQRPVAFTSLELFYIVAKVTSIGERRHRLRIEQRTATRSGYGEAVDTWSTVAEVWCKPTYQMAGSGEGLAGDQMVSTTVVVFDIAYRDGISENMRLVFEGRNYEILYMQKPDFRTSLLIRAQVVE